MVALILNLYSATVVFELGVICKSVPDNTTVRTGCEFYVVSSMTSYKVIGQESWLTSNSGIMNFVGVGLSLVGAF